MGTTSPRACKTAFYNRLAQAFQHCEYACVLIQETDSGLGRNPGVDFFFRLAEGPRLAEADHKTTVAERKALKKAAMELVRSLYPGSVYSASLHINFGRKDGENDGILEWLIKPAPAKPYPEFEEKISKLLAKGN